MIVYDIDGGKKHYTASEATFGVETLCGKHLPIDRIIESKVNTYLNCDCEDCLYEIEKDLKRRSTKKKPVSGKSIPLSV